MSYDAVGRPMEVLLVEDNLVDARITVGALKKGEIKHRLTWLRDGVEAIEFLFRQNKFARAPVPDLILLDLGLPGKDGREVLAEVKSDAKLRDIPVVVLTASDAHEDLLKSQSLGVDGYMTKPVDFDKFLSLVRQLKQHWRDDVVLPAL